MGWGATVREIDHLATLFRSGRHVAPLHSGPAPDSFLPYASPHVELVPVRPSGGDSVWARAGALVATPGYLKTILRELRHADVVHLRCPANISLVASLVLGLMQKPRARWIKYAGNWQPERGARGPLASRFQRWWLRQRLHGAVVTVNGEWPGQPSHVAPLVNPCLTAEEIEVGRRAAEDKNLGERVNILFVGRIDTWKGADRAVALAMLLKSASVSFQLHLVGDGPLRGELEQRCREGALMPDVFFHGWLPRRALDLHYSAAHFILLPSVSEGWPKVLSEGMAYGAVPLASAVSGIPQRLQAAGAGVSLPARDVAGFRDAILRYLHSSDLWLQERARCVAAAAEFSYAHYVATVRTLLNSAFDLGL